MKRITLQDIADRAGVSRNTVSCALRNHPSYPVSTCLRIQALAREMGYQPDPRLSELMSYLSTQRRAPSNTVLAFVHDWPFEFLHPKSQNDPSCFLGARKRAEALGFIMEEFRFDRKQMTDKRFSRMLSARGIRGLLFGPMQHSSTSFHLLWKSFCSVAIGFTIQTPRMNRASNYQLYSLQLALRKTAALGYQRPAIWLPKDLNARVNDAWQAAHGLENKITGRDIPYIERNPESATEIARFIREKNVDALITFMDPATIKELIDLERRSIPDRLGVITLHRAPFYDFLQLSGIDQQWEKVGAAAVDMLVSELNLNRTGLPDDPKTLFIEGRWVDGQTTRKRAATPLPA